MELTAEQIAQIAAQAATEAVDKLKEPERKLTPGDDDTQVKVITDEGDRPFKSFGEQLHAIVKAETTGEVDPRLHGIMAKATGLSEQVAADGGFLVQQEFVDELIQRVYETGVVAAMCAKQPVGAGFNGIKIPAVDETSRADGSRWGGVRAYWLNEGGTKTASKPAFRHISLELQKLIGLCYVTDELLQDAIGLGGYIKRWFPLEFGFKLDDAVINGDGAGKPLGIRQSPCVVSVSKETGQAATTIDAQNIIKMWARMWGPSRRKAVWFINQDIEPQLYTMSLPVGTAGIPIYMPANGLAGQPYGTLFGRPVMPIEQCQTLGTSGDIILADMSQYLLIEKGGMQAASSIHVKFTTDETAFRFVYRVNGQPTWNSPLTPFKGSNTLSPFVVLATRS